MPSISALTGMLASSAPTMSAICVAVYCLPSVVEYDMALLTFGSASSRSASAATASSSALLYSTTMGLSGGNTSATGSVSVSV